MSSSVGVGVRASVGVGVRASVGVGVASSVGVGVRASVGVGVRLRFGLRLRLLVLALVLVLGACRESFAPCGPTFDRPIIEAAAIQIREVDDARVNIVFVTEGVMAAEIPVAIERAQALLDGALRADRKLLGRVREHVAGWVVPLESASARLRNSETDDTALGGCLQRDATGHGRLMLSLDRVRTIVQHALPRVRVDAIVVLFATSGRPNTHSNIVLLGAGDDVDTLVHELGHALVGLGDEYAEGDACWEGPRPGFTTWVDPFPTPNLTLDATGAKWSAQVRGAEVGGDGAATCIYHPPGACRMKDRATNAWCAVCEATLARWALAVRHNDGPPRCDVALATAPDAVAVGPTQIDAMAEDDDGVRTIQVSFDGREVLHVTRPETQIARTLYANTRVVVGHGVHRVEVRCADAEGEIGLRAFELETR